MNYQEGLGPPLMGKSPWVEGRRAASSGELDQANERSGAFCQILMARNGTAFTEAVISSAAEGTLLSREAANLLGVRVRTLPSIAKHIFGSTLNLADYWLDSNVFIEGRKGPYGFDIAPRFWAVIDEMVAVGRVSSSTLVYHELSDVQDELAEWAGERRTSGIFVEPDTLVQAGFRK